MKITPFLKKPLVLALTVALLAMMVAPAFATENLYLSNPELNYYTYQIVSTNTIARGRYFVGNDEYLSRFTFYLCNQSASTGTVTAKLYNTTAEHLPDVLQETSSTTYDLIGLNEDTFKLVDFEFADTYLLNSTVEYCITLEAVTYGNSYRIGLSNNGAGGVVRTTVTWATHYLQPIFYLYTDDESGGGAPYTPPGTTDPTSWDELITDFTSFVVPLVVMMLPAFILCFITRRVDKWLLLIGLAIGAGLGYYFGMVPLWLVFLVSIGLIGMAYQSVRGGGAE